MCRKLCKTKMTCMTHTNQLLLEYPTLSLVTGAERCQEHLRVKQTKQEQYYSVYFSFLVNTNMYCPQALNYIFYLIGTLIIKLGSGGPKVPAVGPLNKPSNSFCSEGAVL